MEYPAIISSYCDDEKSLCDLLLNIHQALKPLPSVIIIDFPAIEHLRTLAFMRDVADFLSKEDSSVELLVVLDENILASFLPWITLYFDVSYRLRVSSQNESAVSIKLMMTSCHGKKSLEDQLFQSEIDLMKSSFHVKSVSSAL